MSDANTIINDNETWGMTKNLYDFLLKRSGVEVEIFTRTISLHREIVEVFANTQFHSGVSGKVCEYDLNGSFVIIFDLDFIEMLVHNEDEPY